VAFLAGAIAVVRGARADLVVLTDGEFFKVERFEIDGGRAKLTLVGGGIISLPILRVERVVDDEIEPAPPALSEGAAPAVAEPLIPVAFDLAQPIPDVPFGATIYEAAKRHRVNPRIVAEMARAESAFHASAVSYKGACGLLQLMPATGRRFGLRRSELFDPKKNVDVAWLLERFEGKLDLVLAAYNAGENAVERHGGVPPYRETRGYVRKILTALRS
jgi:soluble lytic murein transglycosylase-like protein